VPDSPRIRCVIKHVGQRPEPAEVPVQPGALARVIGAREIQRNVFSTDNDGRIMVVFDADYVQRDHPANVQDPSIEFGFHAFYGSLVFVRVDHDDRPVSMPSDEAGRLAARVGEFSM